MGVGAEGDRGGAPAPVRHDEDRADEGGGQGAEGRPARSLAGAQPLPQHEVEGVHHGHDRDDGEGPGHGHRQGVGREDAEGGKAEGHDQQLGALLSEHGLGMGQG